jgi:hypothetical protein
MGLKRLPNGQYDVTTEKQAKEALKVSQELTEEIAELQKEHGILEMMDDATELKKAVLRFAQTKGMRQINFPGYHATLVEVPYASQIVGTKDDLPEGDAGFKTHKDGVIPLRTIIFKKFKSKTKAKEIWKRATKRVVDSEAVDELVAEGILTVDEVAPAFIEKMKTPFLRVYKDAE